MNTKKIWKIMVILIFGLVLAGGWFPYPSHPARAAGPWYVAPGGSNDNDCLSPSTPCETIQRAIQKAGNGGTIYVALGTYTNSGNWVVLINKNITLSGGWDETFITQQGLSYIDGENLRGGIKIEGKTATLEHFGIKHGDPGIRLDYIRNSFS